MRTSPALPLAIAAAPCAAPALADDLPTLQRSRAAARIVGPPRIVDSVLPPGRQTKAGGYSMDLCNKLVTKLTR